MIAPLDAVPSIGRRRVVTEALEISPFGCISGGDPFLDRFSRRVSTAASAWCPSYWDMRLMPAKDILQSYLDDMGDIVMRERFEDYAARIQLPLNIITASASLTVRTLKDLEDGFDDFNEMIQSLGVTAMLRTVKIARFIGNDHVIGIYDTRLMGSSRQVLPTFHSKIWIGTYDGLWKAIRIQNTTNDARWPMLYTRLAEAPWPIEEN
jgi:hypothetical protein